MHLKPMHSVADLDAALAASAATPVLLFKHSHTCGISNMAFDEMQAHLEGRPFPVCYGLITVQTGRHVSDEVVRRLGVRHESPQVILVRDGQVMWHASHHHVTAQEIESALREHLPSA